MELAKNDSVQCNAVDDVGGPPCRVHFEAKPDDVGGPGSGVWIRQVHCTLDGTLDLLKTNG